jgi:hypothetical protein
LAKVTVTGVVSRLNKSGNGFGVREVQEWSGNTRTTYWSVFPPRDAARAVVEGQEVTVSGFLGTKVSEKDGRFVDHTVNQAMVEGSGELEPVSVGSWETVPPGDAGIPF